jgi:hypothetical protein
VFYNILPQSAELLEATPNNTPAQTREGSGTSGELETGDHWVLIKSNILGNIRRITSHTHISFTPRQKGFVDEADCLNHVHILNELLKIAWKTGIVLIQLDISKAVDTVPREAIEDALRREGFPKCVYVFRCSYKGIKTVIKQGSREVPIQIKRGVKQGDPLSPFIFNSVLEPLIIKM